MTTSVAVKLARFARVRQRFVDDRIQDVPAAVRKELARIGLSRIVKPGQRIAITAGSRGIQGIVEILRTVVDEVKAVGAKPFVVAGMGSHGNATSEGQREVLTGYGVTETSMGCPIVTDMDAVELGRTPNGYTIYMDKNAFNSDGILVVNRVKPHTILVGDLGSGLGKMLVIGLGKQKGADSVHVIGIQQSLIPALRIVLSKAPVALGLAIVENSFDHTAKIEAVLPRDIESADVRNLKLARDYLPNIPFDPLDFLIVGQMGKNIAGTGMDPNVIGLHRRLGGPPQREIGRILCLDLTADSHGNANGIGMADIITQRLRDKVDLDATYMNGLTAGFLWGIKMPIALPTDREALSLLTKPYPPTTARGVFVRDTAHLDTMLVTEALLPNVRNNPNLMVDGAPEELRFDERGSLVTGV
ncbi:MAG: lactate racemase domain-containing protein [Chloroflexota bacterium]|nr:lactate racemase domain-containing protein [Chloroflexota bacterium]